MENRIDEYIGMIKGMISDFNTFKESHEDIVEFAINNISKDDEKEISLRDDFKEIKKEIQDISEIMK